MLASRCNPQYISGFSSLPFCLTVAAAPYVWEFKLAHWLFLWYYKLPTPHFREFSHMQVIRQLLEMNHDALACSTGGLSSIETPLCLRERHFLSTIPANKWMQNLIHARMCRACSRNGIHKESRHQCADFGGVVCWFLLQAFP